MGEQKEKILKNDASFVLHKCLSDQILLDSLPVAKSQRIPV